MSHLQQGLSLRPHNPIITMTLKEQINTERIPAHVAIIMDGNGRWAKARGQHRSMGHQEGVEAVREITTTASNLGVRFLTLYTFSTENWNRPAAEVHALMALMVAAIQRETPDLMRNNVRLEAIGDLDRLPAEVRATLEECLRETSGNTGTTLVLALSYSARWEILRATRELAEAVRDGRLRPEEVTEACFSDHLTTRHLPDPDLMIRTGGEQRISNFLLWQLSYAELYFTDTYWPDFREEELYTAILDYQHRERRFGKTGEQLK